MAKKQLDNLDNYEVNDSTIKKNDSWYDLNFAGRTARGKNVYQKNGDRKPKQFEYDAKQSKLSLGVCPGGSTPLVPSHVEKGILYAHCQCNITWWFTFKVKPKEKLKEKDIPKKCKQTVLSKAKQALMPKRELFEGVDLSTRQHGSHFKISEVEPKFRIQANKVTGNFNIGSCPSGGGDIPATYIVDNYVYGLCTCGPVWWRAEVKTKPKEIQETMGNKASAEDTKRAFSRGGAPRCPNHNEKLETSFLELKEGKGKGVCPISGAIFEWTEDPQLQTKDKFGHIEKTFILTGDETP